MATNGNNVTLTPAELMAKIGVAGAAGDIAEVVRLGNQLKKYQGDIQKAEAEKLKAESEALAGERTKLAVAIWKAVRQIPELKAKLDAVKATGFTFKLDAADGVEYKSVALTVPTIKTNASGRGGGSTGLLKKQTGYSRHELVSLYGTPEEKAAIQLAEETEAAKPPPNRPDSARYRAEEPVVKRILADNHHLIKS